ncbi:MAG: metallophosphoesterase, partial [Planctomycetes bacterium]|nr:metallophosphoesterase [Planctomycetota bacterium]
MKHTIVFLTVCMFFITGFISETSTIAGPQDATGVVYNDVNGNGIQDAREVGIAKVAVSNGTDVVTTDSNGQYKLL